MPCNVCSEKHDVLLWISNVFRVMDLIHFQKVQLSWKTGCRKLSRRNWTVWYDMVPTLLWHSGGLAVQLHLLADILWIWPAPGTGSVWSVFFSRSGTGKIDGGIISWLTFKFKFSFIGIACIIVSFMYRTQTRAVALAMVDGARHTMYLLYVVDYEYLTWIVRMRFLHCHLLLWVCCWTVGRAPRGMWHTHTHIVSFHSGSGFPNPFPLHCRTNHSFSWDWDMASSKSKATDVVVGVQSKYSARMKLTFRRALTCNPSIFPNEPS